MSSKLGRLYTMVDIDSDFGRRRTILVSPLDANYSIRGFVVIAGVRGRDYCLYRDLAVTFNLTGGNPFRSTD